MSNENKVVTNRTDFLSMFDKDGIPLEPFTVKRGTALDDLELVTSLTGVTLEYGVWLSELRNLTSLNGCVLNEFNRLHGLSKVKPLSDITFAKEIDLHGLSSITSLDGIVLLKGMELAGLTALTSLQGVALTEDVTLRGLTSVRSIEGITLPKGVTLHDLDHVDISPNPSPDELDILRRIPLNGLRMDYWHCGTSHCLAGWAQVLTDIPADDSTAYDDGCSLLPSMQGYMHCTDEQILPYLESLHV